MQKKDRNIPNQLIVSSSAEKRMPLARMQDSTGGSRSSRAFAVSCSGCKRATALGRLRCDAALGTGSSFEVWLPSNPYEGSSSVRLWHSSIYSCKLSHDIYCSFTQSLKLKSNNMKHAGPAVPRSAEPARSTAPTHLHLFPPLPP
jgi:hypothetical protein